MSAKKRGPGRPPKSKNKKPSAAAVHTVPQHFWAQVGAILLAVVTAIITVGLFGVGGVLPGLALEAGIVGRLGGERGEVDAALLAWALAERVAAQRLGTNDAQG